MKISRNALLSIFASLSGIISTASALDLENYDDLTGYFSQFNSNVVYAATDLGSTGDLELRVDAPSGGFSMVLRKIFQGQDRSNDTFLHVLSERPVFVFDYINLSSTDSVTLALTFQNDILPEWLTIGNLNVPAGGAGTFALNLSDNPDLLSLINRWKAGEGTTFAIRIAQQTGSGISSSVGYDNFSLQPASYLDREFLLIDNFDSVTGSFQKFNGNAAYEVKNLDEDSDNELQVTFATAGFNMPLRYSFPSLNRATDPLLAALNDFPVLAFAYWNLSSSESVNVGLLMETDLLSDWLPITTKAVSPGANGVFSYNLMEDDAVSSLISRWLSGEGTVLRLRIVQDSDAPSSMGYDDFSLRDATFIEEGPGRLVLEDFDSATGFFQQFNNANAVYETGDFNNDGDNELRIAFAKSGFNMGLRKPITRQDPFLGDLEANPGFYFDYVNLSETEVVTVGVALANDFSEGWPALGTIEVGPGDSGTFAIDLWNNETFTNLLAQWKGGAGTFFQLRILQSTEAGVLSNVAFDNFELGEAPAIEAPVNVVFGDWALDENLGWLFGLGSDWALSLQMDYIYYADYPWLYQAQHGWMFFASRSTDDLIYLYSQSFEWIFTPVSIPNWFYVYATDTWMKFSE